MRIVTFSAAHLTEAHRMHRGHIKLLALLLVTLETNIRLSCRREHRVLGDMYSVTTGTGNISILMGTAFPTDMLIVMMACQAHAVLLFDRFIRLESKIQYRGTLLTRSDSANMATPFQRLFHRSRTGYAWSMTGFTLELGKRRTFVPWLAVFGFENIEHWIIGIFIMTFDAGVSAFFRKFPL